LIRNALDKEQAKRVGKLSELPAGSSISVASRCSFYD